MPEVIHVTAEKDSEPTPWDKIEREMPPAKWSFFPAVEGFHLRREFTPDGRVLIIYEESLIPTRTTKTEGRSAADHDQ